MRVDDLKHAAARLVDVEAQRLRDHALEFRMGPVLVELDLAAQEIVGIDVTEDDVDVGDGQAVVFVADADIGAGRFGTDAQALIGVDLDRRTGAGTRRIDRHHRQRQAVPGEVGVLANAQHAIDQQTHVEAGAAHVRRDRVLDAELVGKNLGAHEPADGPGDDRLVKARIVHVDGAAIGKQRQQPAVITFLDRRVLDAEKGFARQFGREALDQQAFQAIVLARNRRDVGGTDDRDLAPAFFDDRLGDPPRGILVLPG